MASLTPNYGLKKPGQDDFYDIDDFNANTDKLDAHKHTKNQITDFPESIKNPQSLNISLNGTSQGEYDGSVAKSINVTPANVGAAPASHSHTKSNITDFPSSMKNPNGLNISLNGTSQGGYDGSAAKAINITPSGIGAAPTSHNHSYLPLTGGAINGELKLINNSILRTDEISDLSWGNFMVAGSDGTFSICDENTRKLVINARDFLVMAGDASTTDSQPLAAIDCRTDGAGIFMQSDVIYKRTYESGASIVATTSGTLGRLTSSSQRYKTDIVYLSHQENSAVVEKEKLSRARSKSVINPSSILNIPVVTFKYNEGYVTGGDYQGEPILGFIAEDIQKVFPEAVIYSVGYEDSVTGEKYSVEELQEAGKTEPDIIKRCKEFKDFDNPEAWNANVMIPAMLKVIQDLHTDLENEKKQRLTIEERLGAAEALLSGNKS